MPGATRMRQPSEVYPETSETDTYAPPEHEADVRKLLGTRYDVMEVAAVIIAHPIYEAEFYDYLQQTRGNAFVAEVAPWIEAWHAGTAGTTLPGLTDHSKDVQGRGWLANDQVETSVDHAAPAPTDALPYDGRGGWDAVEINTRLGQVDQIKETNSDGDRCAFATVLASQIFAGPAAVASWTTAYEQDHADKTSTRQVAAKGVLAAVRAAITAGTATYGDLQWMQEALHDLVLARDHAGTKSSYEVVSPGIEDFTEIPEKACTTEAQVRKAAKTLQPGERMMVEWHAEELFSGTIGHQLMLYNDAGLIYLYDPQPFADGIHLIELDSARLAYYFDRAKYRTSTLTMAGKVSPKAAAAK